MIPPLPKNYDVENRGHFSAGRLRPTKKPAKTKAKPNTTSTYGNDVEGDEIHRLIGPGTETTVGWRKIRQHIYLLRMAIPGSDASRPRSDCSSCSAGLPNIYWAIFPIKIWVLWSFLAPLYGGGALLIREVVRRTGQGWPAFFVLAFAYAVLEEAFTTQTLFNPDYLHLNLHLLQPAYIPALGIGGWWTIFVLTLHTVWSISVSIALVEALVPRPVGDSVAGMDRPHRDRVLFTLAAIASTAHEIKQDHFVASRSQFIWSTVICIVAIAVAFILPARRAGRVPGRVPSPWLHRSSRPDCGFDLPHRSPHLGMACRRDLRVAGRGVDYGRCCLVASDGMERPASASFGGWRCSRLCMARVYREARRRRRWCKPSDRERSFRGGSDFAAGCRRPPKRVAGRFCECNSRRVLNHSPAQLFQRILRPPPHNSVIPQGENHRTQKGIDEECRAHGCSRK